MYEKILFEHTLPMVKSLYKLHLYYSFELKLKNTNEKDLLRDL